MIRLGFQGPGVGLGVSFRLQRARVVCSATKDKADGSSGRRALEAKVKLAPTSPGIYMFRDEHGALLYIGKSKSLRARVRTYMQVGDTAKSARIRAMVEAARDIEFLVTPSESAALALEASMVKEHQPPFNVLLKDDKKASYILVTHSDEYPRLVMTRTRNTKHAQDRVYGPFVDANELKRTLQTIRRVFPLRQRPKPLFSDRPCLNFEIGRCPGVCQRLVSPEDYHKTVHEAEMIFQGRLNDVINLQEQRMWMASDEERYEDATELRDNIVLLQSVGTTIDDSFSAQGVAMVDPSVSCDIVAGATAAGITNAQIFQVRSGKVVNRFTYSSQNLYGSDDLGHVMMSAIQEHYDGVRHPSEIPEKIITMGRIPETTILRKALSEIRGKAVSITSSKKSGLVSLVQRNAEVEVEARLNRQQDVEAGLEDLAELLKAASSDFGIQNSADDDVILHRIECYDISHISGAHAVGSRAVLVDGIPDTRLYRKYYLQDPESSSLGNPDDFMSMKEVLRRRFAKKGGSDQWPDLVIIDGGKGQLSAAVEVLNALDIDIVRDIRVVSLAKREEEVFVPGIMRPINKGVGRGVRLLMLARDEAHRFAVSSHRYVGNFKTLQNEYIMHINSLWAVHFEGENPCDPG